MKNMKFLAFAAAAIMMVSSVVYFNSCKKDPCKDVVCNNGGTCVDGTCSCTTGYEGADCSTEMRTKFLLSTAGFTDAGTSDSSYNNTTGHSYSGLTYNMTITKGTGINDLIISGIGGYGCTGGSTNITATMTSSTAFTIASQVACNYTFSGSGTVTSAGKVQITYTATYAYGGHDVKTVTDHGVATQN